MIKNLFNPVLKGIAIGVGIGIGVLATIAIAVTVSTTFEDGDLLTAHLSSFTSLISFPVITTQEPSAKADIPEY